MRVVSENEGIILSGPQANMTVIFMWRWLHALQTLRQNAI